MPSSNGRSEGGVELSRLYIHYTHVAELKDSSVTKLIPRNNSFALTFGKGEISSRVYEKQEEDGLVEKSRGGGNVLAQIEQCEAYLRH